MSLKPLTQEFVELVKVDQNGQEHRIAMPRWLAEIAIDGIPAEASKVALFRIEPVEVDPKAPYPLKLATLEETWGAALVLANYLPVRLVA